MDDASVIPQHQHMLCPLVTVSKGMLGHMSEKEIQQCAALSFFKPLYADGVHMIDI